MIRVPKMKQKPFPSQVAPRFMIRMPDGMRETIADIAERNNRSMNAEIVDRLSASLEADKIGVSQIDFQASLLDVVTQIKDDLRDEIRKEVQEAMRLKKQA